MDFLSLARATKTSRTAFRATKSSARRAVLFTAALSAAVEEGYRILRCSRRRPFLLRAVVIKALRRRHLLPAFAPSRKRSEREQHHHHRRREREYERTRSRNPRSPSPRTARNESFWTSSNEPGKVCSKTRKCLNKTRWRITATC